MSGCLAVDLATAPVEMYEASELSELSELSPRTAQGGLLRSQMWWGEDPGKPIPLPGVMI
jgi:hypothetical protein